MRRIFVAVVGIFLMGAGAAASAAPFDGIYVFGDSLSDNGNVFALSGQPAPPYYNGRFSNGPVAVEDLAARFYVPLIDYAFGGATTGALNINPSLGATGMLSQLGMYSAALGGGSADPDALYVVWGGPNDFHDGASLLDPATAPTAVGNLGGLISGLAGLGARRFLVPGMPDLGLTPGILAADTVNPGTSALATLRSMQFNALLLGMVHDLDTLLPGDIAWFDTFGLMHDVLAHAADFGLTNVTQACIASAACAFDPAVAGGYFFWDDLHPTAGVHALLGERFAAAVPEPASLTLVVLGIGLFASLRERLSRRA